MLNTESNFFRFFVVPVLAIAVGLLLGKLMILSIDRSVPAAHEKALPWPALDKGFKAITEPDKNVLHMDILNDLRKMEGKKVIVFGFMFPLEQGEKHTHFLLGSRGSSCPFCYAPGGGNMIDITMDEPVAYERDPILLKGTFAIGDGKETGLVYSVSHAELLPQ